MAATIFQNLRVTAASIFTTGFSHVAPKYQSTILYDPTCFLARFAVNKYNEKEVLFLLSLTFFI